MILNFNFLVILLDRLVEKLKVFYASVVALYSVFNYKKGVCLIECFRKLNKGPVFLVHLC